MTYDLPKCLARSFFSSHMETQLVTGATQEARIFTGSALRAAPHPSRARAKTPVSPAFNRRMSSSLAAFVPVDASDAPARLCEQNAAAGKPRLRRRRLERLWMPQEEAP